MGNIFGSVTKPDDFEPPKFKPIEDTTFHLPPDMTMEQLMGTCNDDGTKVPLNKLPTHTRASLLGGNDGGDPFAELEAFDKEHHGKQTGGMHRTDFSDTEDHISDGTFNKHIRGLLEKHHGGQSGGCNCAMTTPPTEQKGGSEANNALRGGKHHKDKKHKPKKYYEESSDSSSTTVSSSSTTTSDSIKLDDKADSSSSVSSSSSSSSESIMSRGVLNLEVGGQTTNGIDEDEYGIEGGKNGISIFPFNSITTNKSDDVSGKKKKKYRRRT
jgi:hypothetical protein